MLMGSTSGGLPVGTHYYHGNHLGSASLVTDSDGEEVMRINYTPYGEIDQAHSGKLGCSEGASDTSYEKCTRYGLPWTKIYNISEGKNAGVTRKFTGQEYDPENSLYYYNARYYDPSIGIFTTADTVIPDPGDPLSYNRYMYVRGNPVKYIDPSGHCIDISINTHNGEFDCRIVSLSPFPEDSSGGGGYSDRYYRDLVYTDINGEKHYGSAPAVCKDQCVRGIQNWIDDIHNRIYVDNLIEDAIDNPTPPPSTPEPEPAPEPKPKPAKTGGGGGYQLNLDGCQYCGPSGGIVTIGPPITSQTHIDFNSTLYKIPDGLSASNYRKYLTDKWFVQAFIDYVLPAMSFYPVGLGVNVGAAAIKTLARKQIQEALTLSSKFLGKGKVRVITNKAGDKIFLSADGLRKIRFDMKNPHGLRPHAHVEVYKNGGWYPADDLVHIFFK